MRIQINFYKICLKEIGLSALVKEEFLSILGINLLFYSILLLKEGRGEASCPV